MDFKNNSLFAELVAAHKDGLKLSRSKGNASAYRVRSEERRVGKEC